MNRMYKYHARLYRLYQEFGDGIFYTKQTIKIFQDCDYVNHTTLGLKGLEARELIRRATKEEVAKEVKDFDYRRTYRRLTEKGLRDAKYIDENPRVLTMYLLRH